MQNARLRLGRLEYFRAPANSRSAPTHITLWMDRTIVEPTTEANTGVCHLLSAFGGDQETSALAAAISEHGGRFTVSGPDLIPHTVSVQDKATVFRSSLALPGRKHPVKHIVALSEELVQTQAGLNPRASRTVLYEGDPHFMVYRLGIRFGIPVLPEWCTWIASELTRRRLSKPLLGVGCSPVVVEADKKLLLSVVSSGLKAGLIGIPADTTVVRWSVRRSIAS
jgi:hypothetical protein